MSYYDLVRLVDFHTERIQRALTPSEEEQTARILAGKCPHNKGWRETGHSHNSDAYECILCKETKFW